MAPGRSAGSHAVEGEASSHQWATSPRDQTVHPTHTVPSSRPTPTTPQTITSSHRDSRGY